MQNKPRFPDVERDFHTRPVYPNKSAMGLQYVGPDPLNLEVAWQITLSKWYLLAFDKKFARCDDGGWTTCGLCSLYLHKHGCCMCPIKEEYDYNCKGTPYEDYKKTWRPEDAEREYAMLLTLYREWKEG